MARKSETQKLKKLSGEFIPTLWIGKNGVNEAIIRELREQLKLRKRVKVRILKSALHDGSRKDVADELSQASGARLIELKGANAVYQSPFRITRLPKNGHVDQRK